jgi:hypothetical protein
MEKKFNSVNYHHIYRTHDGQAESLAKEAKQFEQSTLKINEEYSQIYLP